MFENLLIIVIAYMLAAMAADAFSSAQKAADKIKAQHALHKDFKRRQKEITALNTQTLIESIYSKIVDGYARVHGTKPDKKKLRKMMLREYEQMLDYGLIDNLGRYTGEFV